MRNMTPHELYNLIDSGISPVLIDVREAHELQHGIIAGAMHIPMNDIPSQLDALAAYQQQPVVLICRSGKRSAQVGQFMEHVGFSNVINLDGGMNGWAIDVDPNMVPY